MIILRLPAWDVTHARQKMNELIEPMPNFACWVGSVPINDSFKVSDFMAKAKTGDVQGLQQYQAIGGDLLYAVLLNVTHDNWKLVIIESPESPSVSERPIFSTMVRQDFSVEVCHRQETAVEQKLKQDSRPRFRDVLKELIRFRIT